MPDVQKYLKRRWANWAVRRSLRFQLPAPMVSFTFDDVPYSAFENGAPLLEEFGWRGTFYLSFSLQQAAGAEGFTRQQALEAKGRGHELGCHTYGHLDVSRTGSRELQEDLEHNQRCFEDLLPWEKVQSFSYPFGAQTADSKRLVSERFSTARGILPGIHTGRADLLNLKAFPLYESRVPPGLQLERIRQAARAGGWLIFYTHDVQENYSQYGCSPAYLRAVAGACGELGLKGMSIREAVKQLYRFAAGSDGMPPRAEILQD